MTDHTLWPKIIYFDGNCILCNRMVDFLIRIDRRRKFKYASLQSGFRKDNLPAHLWGKPDQDSVVFIEEGRIYLKSAAILKVLRLLGFPWNLFAMCYLVPTKMRDRMYDYIASKRYGWFGKRQQCRVPDENTRDRILG